MSIAEEVADKVAEEVAEEVAEVVEEVVEAEQTAELIDRAKDAVETIERHADHKVAEANEEAKRKIENYEDEVRRLGDELEWEKLKRSEMETMLQENQQAVILLQELQLSSHQVPEAVEVVEEIPEEVTPPEEQQNPPHENEQPHENERPRKRKIRVL